MRQGAGRQDGETLGWGAEGSSALEDLRGLEGKPFKTVCFSSFFNVVGNFPFVK